MRQKRNHIKQHGVHYTPSELATFLARVTYDAARHRRGSIDVLDPACGDGALLGALAESVPQKRRTQLKLFGYEQDPVAATSARRRLANLGANHTCIFDQDFLDVDRSSGKAHYDIVIANPPYVRTQVLGAKRAQQLAQRFGITGRVDLYHAFTVAMACALRERGVLGLLTSNRFLTIKSGISLRRFLTRRFQLQSVFDLGDTRLFDAAVLPVIVVAEKRSDSKQRDECSFTRVYQQRPRRDSTASVATFAHVLDAVQHPDFVGLTQTNTGRYQVARGILSSSGTDDIWSLATPENVAWLETVHQHRQSTFGDVAQIRVGIKTTADAVFIRKEWRSLPKDIRPEKKLLRTLITHHQAARWHAGGSPLKSVLYPHESHHGKRVAIRLTRYPRAAAYLETHAARLQSRTYVINGGREWFEIWVPHHPDDWMKKKIVFPDISERPKFFLDESGAIVNGDCYWMTLKPGVDDDWLYLILAVANSSFIEEYYDVSFHNKLYAGRRRFMTQYVKQFPLPDLASATAKKIVRNVKKLLDTNDPTARVRLETCVEALVWQSFGFDQDARDPRDLASRVHEIA